MCRGSEIESERRGDTRLREEGPPQRVEKGKEKCERSANGAKSNGKMKKGNTLNGKIK